MIAVVRGDACLVPDDGEVTHPHGSDLAIVRGPGPYRVADDPGTAPQVVIHPGQRCTTAEGAEVGLSDLGVRAWGNGATGRTVLLTGTYDLGSEVSQRLLAALPATVVLRADVWENPLVGYLADQIGRDEPGQEAVLDRLLDLLLIAALRAWFARPEPAAPGWYRAAGDPVVGPALRLIQHQPAHPWTVAALAAAVGVSRAAFARQFTDLVEEPPMTFLTGWRLALAADLLREPDATVTSVARRVGYTTPFALSAAFKRIRGVSPTQHRSAGDG